VSLDPEYYRREVFLNIAILTKEYPPHIYGGAGAHVEHLTRELGNLDGGAHEIQVLCFGDQNENAGKKRVIGIHAPQSIQVHDERHRTLVDTLERNGAMVGLLKQADVIHCHTWYTHLAGCLLREMLDAPLVLTTHSLELQRPWKREQLGTGYYASSWIEKTAYQNADGVVAVSAAMREDVHNLYHVAKRSPSSTTGLMMTSSGPERTRMCSFHMALTRPGPTCSW
jgi:starch synthase